MSWFIDRERTGIDVYTYELIKKLIKQRKNDEEIWLIHYSHSEEEIYNKTNEIILNFFRLPNVIIIKYFFEPFILKKYNLSLLHFPTHCFFQIPHYFFGKYKKIVTIHDLTPLLFSNTHTIQDSFLWTNSFKIIKNKIDNIIAVSEATKNDLIKYMKIKKEKIKVIYNGYDSNIFKPIHLSIDDVVKFRKEYNLPDNFILYVGTLEKRKNVESLIKALNVLKKKGKKYILVIVGKRGWKYKNIFKLINKYQLNDQIIFIGYVPREDLPLFYNLADVFVYPSLYEGFGLPPLEAMACGCPVITTNVSSLPEVVGNAGILIDNPYDYVTLAETIDEVVQSETLRKDLIKRGLKRSKLFSWEKCAKETWKVYEEILG